MVLPCLQGNTTTVICISPYWPARGSTELTYVLCTCGLWTMDYVIDLGEKLGQSVGFAMSSKGELVYGNLPGNSVISTKTSPELTDIEIDEQHTVAQSEIDLLWPNAFGFDGKGTLAVISDKFHLTQRTDPTVFNYRVLLLRRTGHVYPYNFC